MSSTPIQQAKLRLPLPELMGQLGLGEHAKKNAGCPFHDDRSPSFSVFQRDDGWFWKCHAGCGQGDEITFLEKHENLTTGAAIELFCEMAGCAPVAYPFTRRRASLHRSNNKGFDWQACVKAFKDEHVEQLSSSRGLSGEICSWVKQKGLIGVCNGEIAFPVHDGTGQVVAAHYRTTDERWQYHPEGIKAQPLVVGELEPGSPVHVFESQWDSFAFMDSSGERSGIIITRGASNGARVAELLPKDSTVYAWTQNDAAGEKWQKDVCESAKTVKATVKRVKIPKSHKDLNDWTRAGATGKDLFDALVKAETLYAPVKPRALAELLDDVTGILRRYVVFQYPEQATACALWVAHTWVVEAFDFTPYLHVFSAEKRSGKSRLLDVLELLVKNGWRDGGLTEAVLFRKIKKDGKKNNLPTLLTDEIDTVFHTHRNDGMENIRRMFNLGFTRGYKVMRCVGANTKFEIDEFDPFCAKALCGIGQCLPDTVSDRCIPIELARQSPEERAARFRKRDAEAETESVKLELEAWSQQPDVIEALNAARPQMPGELTDRVEEICEPLIAIADMAGRLWPQKTRAALVKLHVQEEDASIGVKLLSHVKGIFESKETDKLSTTDILDELVEIEDGPWAAWWLDDIKYGKPQKPATKLAKLLKPYGTKERPLKAHSIRLPDGVVKGFEIDDFKHAFERYLPPLLENGYSGNAVTSEGKTVTAPGVVSASGVINEGASVTAPSSKVTASGTIAVTQNRVVKKQSVTDVTNVTPFQGFGIHRPPGMTAMQFLTELAAAFNASPLSSTDRLEQPGCNQSPLTAGGESVSSDEMAYYNPECTYQIDETQEPKEPKELGETKETKESAERKDCR